MRGVLIMKKYLFFVFFFSFISSAERSNAYYVVDFNRHTVFDMTPIEFTLDRLIDMFGSPKFRKDEVFGKYTRAEFSVDDSVEIYVETYRRSTCEGYF
jgi:hypothetical protein